MTARRNRPRYAARLNAFRRPGEGVAGMIAAAGEVGGLSAADLNYPDHFAELSPGELARRLEDAELSLNGLAMRYYGPPEFKLGAFTHPDASVRRAAIDLTREGIDAGLSMGSDLMTLWLGQDGVDYSFQGDYGAMWDWTVEALQAVADHAPECRVAVEYKPNEPRAFALLPDVATTLLALREAGRDNLGVTLDLAHVLYAGEMPAHAAMLVERHARLFGLHLNDGYGKRDDGLMVGTVHPVQTVELLVAAERMGYDGAIYFDTFPDAGGLDPVAEARANIALTERLRAVAGALAGDGALAAAIARQDAAAAMRIVGRALYGA